jgi:hypothetical protein
MRARMHARARARTLRVCARPHAQDEFDNALALMKRVTREPTKKQIAARVGQVLRCVRGGSCAQRLRAGRMPVCEHSRIVPLNGMIRALCAGANAAGHRMEVDQALDAVRTHTHA